MAVANGVILSEAKEAWAGSWPLRCAQGDTVVIPVLRPSP